MEILQEADYYSNSTFKNLFFRPGELLTHLALTSQYLKGLSDVSDCRCFRFWVLKNASYLDVENSGSELAEQNTVGQIFLDLKQGINFKSTVKFRENT